MADNKLKNKKIEVKLGEDLKKRFDKVAREKAVNKSEVIRRLIEKYVKENEGK